MDVPIIHVHTQSDKATVGYATFMWEAMRSLANHPEALRLSVHGIGPTAGDRLKDMPATRVYQVPTDENKTAGSSAHGACIEHALNMTDDGDIHLLVDSDTVVVARGWDDYVRIKLLDEQVGMIGTAVEDLGGFSSGTSHVQMAKNLPTVAWCALSPLHRWRALRAMPHKGSDIPIISEELSKVYNLPVGYHVLRDVGWQIPQYLHDHGITYQAWKQLKSSGTATILKGLSEYHEEYHVGDNVPFVVHQRGSMRHAYRTDRISSAFYGAVDRHLQAEAEASREAYWRWEATASNADVLAKLAKMKADYAAGVPPVVEEPIVAPASAQSTNGTAPIEGWLKAALDGNIVWSRHTRVVTKTIDVAYDIDQTCRHLRLEGTVSCLQVTVPAAPTKPHSMTVRNLTAGPVAVKTSPQNRTIEVPKDACWLILIDVDGVIHVT